MSSNDKIRKKLVESMRKTKAGSNKNRATTDSGEKSKATSAARQKKRTTARKQATTTTKQVLTDPYQNRRYRVWPD